MAPQRETGLDDAQVAPPRQTPMDTWPRVRANAQQAAGGTRDNRLNSCLTWTEREQAARARLTASRRSARSSR
jgi:hypothetical protein